ncbi:MAG: copper resistance protein NlpE N-terminal domain-containing protein [Bacteroidales bacterium]|jgi:heat shock protein HslJ|nr:copper resistance protein NlpE N-terminal domain-containing protein [Bacteroidales bacterium]
MKTRIFIIAVLAVSFSLFSCKSNEKKSNEDTEKISRADSSRESLDWEGTYTGTLPCADCSGIFTIIDLKRDGHYTISTKYLGKSENYIDENGKFSWNDAGNIITFDNKSDDAGMSKFQVGENKLTMLDISGNRITGELADNYILKKVNKDLVEKYWKLEELGKEKIDFKGESNREPHIIFKIAENRIIGSGGCNNIFSTYEVKENNKISILRSASTLMMCPGTDMDIERKFMAIFENVDSYHIEGDNMVLYNSNNEPVAKFKAVYM